MKHLFNHLPKLVAIAAIALSASSCNRAEYAMLPKTTPYHATYHGTAKPAPAPVAQPEEVAVTEAPAIQTEEKNNVVETAAAPVTAPATPQPNTAAAAVAAPAVGKAASATVSRKHTLMERVALSKVTKKLDKLTSKVQHKQKSETAEANAISGNLRTGLILLLVGALITILPGSIFSLIGGIIAIIGLIFIILWLLDQA